MSSFCQLDTSVKTPDRPRDGIKNKVFSDRSGLLTLHQGMVGMVKRKMTERPKQPIELWSVFVVLFIGGVIGAIWWYSTQNKLEVKVATEYSKLIGPVKKAAPIPENSVEVALCENIQAKNWIGPNRSLTVTFSVYAKVDSVEERKALAERVQEHHGTLADRFRRVAAEVTPEQLKDPALRVVKRKMENLTAEILGKGAAEKILIPQWQVQPTE